MEISKIIEQLEKLPSEIRDSQIDYVLAKDLAEKAKLKFKLAQSLALVNAKASNATEKKAMAELQTKVEYQELIEAQTSESIKEAEFNYLSNQFISCRKIASLTEKTYNPNNTGF